MRIVNQKEQTRRNEARALAAEAKAAMLEDCLVYMSMMTGVDIPTLEMEDSENEQI